MSSNVNTIINKYYYGISVHNYKFHALLVFLGTIWSFKENFGLWLRFGESANELFPVIAISLNTISGLNIYSSFVFLGFFRFVFVEIGVRMYNI